MKFHSRRRISPVITVIPMIDILMILLIFFIVTTTFKSAQPQVQIVLPATKSHDDATANTAKPAILAITENGDVFLDDKAVTVDQLGDAVKHLQASGRPLAMKADEKAPVGRMFEVLDALKIAGITNLPALTRAKK